MAARSLQAFAENDESPAEGEEGSDHGETDEVHADLLSGSP
jgi:hypothetical protein